MASVTYGKCYLWQKYYVKCNYGKNIMANETEPNKGILNKGILNKGILNKGILNKGILKLTYPK